MANIFNFLFKRSKSNRNKQIFFIYIGLTNLFVFIFIGIFVFFYYKTEKNTDFSVKKLVTLSYSESASKISGFFFINKIHSLLSSCHDIDSLSEQLKKQLTETNIFSESKIRFSKHNKALTIKYALREPLAYSGNISNSFLDNRGYVFPVSPFSLPKKLPVIFSSSYDSESKKIEEKEAALISKILTYDLPLSVIDVSKISSPRYEIVLTLKNNDILRISSSNLPNAIGYYKYLKNSLYKKTENRGMIFDFRVHGFVFTKTTKPH